MLNHVSSVHEEIRPFECSLCNLKFCLVAKLNNHIAEVHEKKPKPFECSQYNGKFSQKGHLFILFHQFMKKSSHMIALNVTPNLAINKG